MKIVYNGKCVSLLSFVGEKLRNEYNSVHFHTEQTKKNKCAQKLPAAFFGLVPFLRLREEVKQALHFGDRIDGISRKNFPQSVISFTNDQVDGFNGRTFFGVFTKC